MSLKTHRSLVDDLCTLDADDKVQDKSGEHRCHGSPCVVEMLQQSLFASTTGAMHVESLGGLEAHAILDVNQPSR